MRNKLFSASRCYTPPSRCNFLNAKKCLTNKFLRFFGIYNSPEGERYIVCQLFESGSLLDFMRVSPYESLHFTNAEVVKLFGILAGGLLFLHQDKELIHGDLALR